MDVSLTGTFADLPFPSVAAFLARQRATGVLEIDDGRGISRAFFLDGHPQGARLGRVVYPLGRVLAEAKRVNEEQLGAALAEQKESGKLLGQILLERGIIDDAILQHAFEEQSRLSFLSLFGESEGRYEFLSGLVHLADFTSAPLSPLIAIYRGVRDFSPTEVSEGLLAHLAFAAVSLASPPPDVTQQLGDDERDLVTRLGQPRYTGSLARESKLSTKALGALLYALYSLGDLRIEAAERAVR